MAAAKIKKIIAKTDSIEEETPRDTETAFPKTIATSAA